MLLLNPVDRAIMENYDREIAQLNGLDYEDEDELGSLKDFFQKVGGAAKNLVSNLVSSGSNQSSSIQRAQAPQPIIIQQPSMPQVEPKSNTGLIVGLSFLGVAVIGTGIFLYNQSKKAPLGEAQAEQDLGVAKIIESQPQVLNGKRPRIPKKRETLAEAD